MRGLLLLLMLVVASLTLTGCTAIEGIFKAGMWTGIIAVVFLVMIVGFVAAKIRG